MIPIDSKSYPYLAVAQALRMPYGDILKWSPEEIKDQQEYYKISRPVQNMNKDQIEQFVKHQKNVYAREIWNAAIEKAANECDDFGEASLSRSIKRLKI